MKRLIKKAFTIVELVIVIAVIAILAGVLVPTFSNIIKKSQISADVQLCRNLNTVLANAEAENRIPGSVYDVLYLENEAGYVIANLNPTADDMYYAWDEEQNKMIYLMSDLETVYFPEDYELTPGKCWITVGSAEEAAIVAEKGYNLALEHDFNEDITLSNVVSIDTLGFKCSGTVTMADGNNNVETAYLIGQFASANVNSSVSNVVSAGSVTSLNVTNAKSVTVNGSVGTFSAANGVTSTVSATGMVKSVASSNGSSITNNGVIKGNNSTANVSGTAVGVNSTSVSIGTKNDLDAIRTQIASGDRSFEGEKVKLSSDINLMGIASTPIANVSREGISADSKGVFKGEFDGQGYTIKNYSTGGFSITGLNAGTNSSSVKFGDSSVLYNEAIYGLFGVTYNAVIKNVNITVDINLVIDNGEHYVGDSVGGIVGCAFGTIEFINCTVSGSINGYDGVGGLLGRLKGSSATFTNCTNNADVTGVRKTGAFIGSSYKGAYSVTYNNCVNNGDITSLGIEKDIALGAKDNNGKTITGTPEATNFKGYYTASASNGEYASVDFVEGTKLPDNKVKVNGFTNNGTIKVGSVDVGNGTYYDGTDGLCKKGSKQ